MSTRTSGESTFLKLGQEKCFRGFKHKRNKLVGTQELWIIKHLSHKCFLLFSTEWYHCTLLTHIHQLNDSIKLPSDSVPKITNLKANTGLLINLAVKYINLVWEEIVMMLMPDASPLSQEKTWMCIMFKREIICFGGKNLWLQSKQNLVEPNKCVLE